MVRLWHRVDDFTRVESIHGLDHQPTILRRFDGCLDRCRRGRPVPIQIDGLRPRQGGPAPVGIRSCLRATDIGLRVKEIHGLDVVQRVDQADPDLEVGRARAVAAHRQARGTDPAVEHPDELGHRDREPDIGVLDFRHGDPNQSPFLVDDRPAAITRID